MVGRFLVGPRWGIRDQETEECLLGSLTHASFSVLSFFRDRLFFWVGADTANWRGRQSPSWPLLSEVLALSHLRAGEGGGHGFSPALVLLPPLRMCWNSPSLCVLVSFSFVPSESLRVRVILFEASRFIFLTRQWYCSQFLVNSFRDLDFLPTPPPTTSTKKNRKERDGVNNLRPELGMKIGLSERYND